MPAADPTPKKKATKKKATKKKATKKKATKKKATKKKATKKKAPEKKEPPPAPINADLLDKTVGLLITLDSAHRIRQALIDRFEQSPTRADALIAEGRRRLAIAATVDYVERFATSLARLDNLFTRCLAVQDAKTALATQKELNKLLSLRPPDLADDGTPTTDDALGELAAVRGHLAPLLPDQADELPADELARLLAAELIAARAHAA